MRRSRWTRAWLLLGVFVASLASLTGCRVSQVMIEIPGFGDGDVEGVWLWRLSDTTGQYERDCRVTLSAPDMSPAGEYVGYAEQCSNQPDINLNAFVQRAPTDPSTITLVLWYTRFQPTAGSYKASAYNGAGESGLSATALTF
jgi:hypothetical protein